MQPYKSEKRLKVAIIGGGPGGLGAAIELAKLPFIDWDLYEKRPKFSEIGGGFTLQPQTWKLLEHNGTANNINAKDYYRSAEGQIEQRRNGRTQELLVKKYNPNDVPLNHQSCRLARVKLQDALLKNVNQTHVHLSKKLVGVEHLLDSRVRISFEDGCVDEVDFLVAADGVRSFIRKFSFPNHTLRYNGQSVYRTIVSKAEVSKIEGIPWAPIFWKHISGLYVYTCPLGDDDFEVTARIRRPNEGREPVSWGRPFDLHTILHEYNDFCQPIQQVLRLAAKGDTQEFALFSGPRLRSVVSLASIAFIGDASHALLGNFGSGAGFALEDVYTLTKALDWAWSRGRRLADALELFDSIRSPHYQRLYKVVDRFAIIKAALRAEGLSVDEEIAERVRRVSLASESWMYYYEIDKIVSEALREADERIAYDQTTSEPAEQVGLAYAEKVI
ncbi:hypothetical protein VE03_04218 [Pseudogymnoascus sp. 23342-1-I1]|nr:hypothetical protein VE03_04218 [Pseudogymnoascus sp. 23342-1-I1]